MQKLLLPFLLLLLPLNSLWAAKLQVSVSIAPQEYFVKKIGGRHVVVNVMVRLGADPHTYEPSPRQMVSISRSKLYFSMGTEFDEIWVPRFLSANPKMRVISVDEGIPKLEMEGHGHEDEEEHSVDPHIWLSPLLVKIQALHIYEALRTADPANQENYQANYQQFQKELDQLYLDIKQQFRGKAKNPTFAVFHPSWGYFANCFGLKQVAIEVEGKSPKPGQLKNIILDLKKKGIKALFVQPQFSKRSAQTVAKAIQGKVYTLDPLAGNWETNLRETARKLANAIQ
ncbi:MAG: cation ABC transporter substrate-binding protein [SAR324 cluster bacterium]|uniref:Cation ABC transporter substrate-binding protein n=1 Tax=SAR324 cluster bacterium TaxID=2024889 RepID=A0A2A4SSZ0_9DELT|nr:MAG: cation ABC transporter substrate-binding protein [SAR324 cluster bacterium]